MMLRSNVANYTNLAKLLRPAIENMAGKEVKINTIVKALTKSVPSSTWEPQIRYLKKANLTLEYKYSEKVSGEKPVLEDNMLLTYKTERGWKILLRGVEGGELALIRIELPEEASREPGLTLFVVEYLMMQGIRIEKIYRFDTEILLLCEQENADTIIRYLSDLVFKSQI